MGKIQKIGVQLLTLRRFIQTSEDMEKTFKEIKNMGYDSIYINYGGNEYRQIVDLAKEADLEIIGTAYDFKTLLSDLQAVIQNCRYCGSYNVGVHKEVMHSDEIYERFCADVNEIGKELSKSGGKLVYNHHAREFCKMSGQKSGIDILKELTAPEHMSFAINTFWLQNAGVDIRRFISDFSGRIEILRMQDADIAMDYLRGSPAVGCGNMYWDGIIEAAQSSNVKHYIVENEKFLGNLFECLEKSSEFIHKYYM